MSVYTVSNASDGGAGSLRAAMEAANATAEADAIIFAPAMSGQTITLTSGALGISQHQLTIFGDIDGNGTADVTISGNDTTAILSIGATAVVNIDGIVFSHGLNDRSFGASNAATGVVTNDGSLSITHSRFEHNISRAGYQVTTGAQGAGAGTIVNYGTLTVATSVFYANSATGGRGGRGADGEPPGFGSYAGKTGATGGVAAAGILNMAGGILTLPNTGGTSTVFINSFAAGGEGGAGGNASNALYGSTYHTDGGDGGRGGHASLGIVSFGTISGFTFTTGASSFLGGYGGMPGAGGLNGYGTFDPPGSYGASGLRERVFIGYGTSGVDSFADFTGDHTFFALGGDDRIGVANSSVSIIYGGDGQDLIAGGAQDRLYGENGNDTIRGSAGDGGIFDGGAGFDDLLNLDLAGTTGVYDLTKVFFTASGSTGRYYNFEHINGSAFAERMIGNQYENELTGNDGNDTLRGGLNNDTLIGGRGNDELWGEAGVDALIGGSGNDTYVDVTVSHAITETVGAGGDLHDRILSSISFDLGPRAGIEDLTLTGTQTINGTGSAVANRIVGNAQANALSGLGGTDTLDGGGGADTLTGGADGDVYIWRSHTTVVEDAAGTGRDRIESAATLGLANFPNVEDLVLTGSAAISGAGTEAANRIVGNENDNTLRGAGGNDTLTGNGGNDRLYGEGGRDLLAGGTGDDLYVNPELTGPLADIITEAADAGIDTVQSSVAVLLDPIANVENVTLTGGSGVSARGNSLGNTLTGNSGANLLSGASGADTLNGGAGKDVLIGGKGGDVMNGGSQADTFRFEVSNTGADTINGYSISEDRFDLAGGTFSNAQTVGADTRLTHAGGTILIVGVTGLTLGQWNARVLPAGGTASEHEAPSDRGALLGILDWHSVAPAWPPHPGIFGAPDFLFV